MIIHLFIAFGVVSNGSSHTKIFRFKTLGGIIVKKTVESLEEVGDFITTTESLKSLNQMRQTLSENIDFIMLMLACRYL